MLRSEMKTMACYNRNWVLIRSVKSVARFLILSPLSSLSSLSDMSLGFNWNSEMFALHQHFIQATTMSEIWIQRQIIHASPSSVHLDYRGTEMHPLPLTVLYEILSLQWYSIYMTMILYGEGLQKWPLLIVVVVCNYNDRKLCCTEDDWWCIKDDICDICVRYGQFRQQTPCFLLSHQ